MKHHRYLKELFIVLCLVNIAPVVLAEDLSNHQIYLNLIERITKIEEGQKAIVVAGFKAVNERFDMMEKNFEQRFESIEKIFEERFKSIEQRFEQRFESIEQRFEFIDQRFDLMDDRFESLTREMNQRFESGEKRIDLLSNLITNQARYILAVFTAIIGLIGFVLWDRKTALSGVSTKIENLFQSHIEKFHTPREKESPGAVDSQNTIPTAQRISEGFTIPKDMQEKFRDIFKFLNQFPEMRPVLQMN